ncbi:MAG: RNA methyltransferase [Cyanobium sp.]
MALPEQLLLSDLLRLRVRCDQGLDHGPGVIGWMHPPVHRLLGWASRPSAFRPQRQVWRLDQLRGLSDSEAFVKGEPAAADPALLEQLPTLLRATLLGAGGRPLGTVADAAVDLRSGRILHYLIARSDPRLPGSSRWRLTPDRIVDQRSGEVVTAVEGLDDLPAAHSSVKQELLRRSRRWREQMGEETSRLRERFEEVGGRLEERVEGWLEEPPWEEANGRPSRWDLDGPGRSERGRPAEPDPLDGWDDEAPRQRPPGPLPRRSRRFQESEEPRASQGSEESEPWDAPSPDPGDPAAGMPPPRPRPRRGPDRYRGRDQEDDPWV